MQNALIPKDPTIALATMDTKEMVSIALVSGFWMLCDTTPYKKIVIKIG